MDISSLRERGSSRAFSVSELNGFIKNIFDSSPVLNSVTVEGEISNFTYHRSGHLYFSLKDADGQIKSVMFRGNAQGLRFMPENGMKVVAKGSVGVYTRDGVYQLYVSSMQPDGVGALYVAYEKLKEKLFAEGLFSQEHKRPIPKYPSAIGVITSPTGAAVRDIINVITRRFPSAKIYLYPALVQGSGAEASLIEGLDYFERSRLCDTVIIGRGGGSIEDLWAFNGEALARRIYSMTVPIISAVGHETDFTICDFVSDLRAPTPSAAAELAVPDYKDLSLRIDGASDRLDNALYSLIRRRREQLDYLCKSEVLSSPDIIFTEFRERKNSLFEAVYTSFCNITERYGAKLSAAAGRLHALSPLAVLNRGYSISFVGDKTLRSVDDVKEGDKINIRLPDGCVFATADYTTREGKDKNGKS